MDFHDSMIQTEMLFQSRIISFGYKEYSLETYADRGALRSWKAREGCADTDEMRAGLNIDGILRSADPSESEVLTYIQYVLNIGQIQMVITYVNWIVQVMICSLIMKEQLALVTSLRDII